MFRSCCTLPPFVARGRRPDRRHPARRVGAALHGLALVVLFAVSATLWAESLPSLPVKTLGGTSLILPAALRGSDSLLVIGFTQRSERETVVWRKRSQEGLAARITVYPVIVIAGIPRIFRGLILSGIRAGYPRRAWNHFLVVSRDEARWKAAVGWQGPNRAYVLLLDRSGRIVWRRNGPYTRAGGRSLARAASALASTAPGAPLASCQ